MTAYYAKKALEIVREEGFPQLLKRSIVYLLWNTILSNYQKLKIKSYILYLDNKLQYDCPAKPFQRIYIDPNQVKYRIRKDNQGNFVVPRPYRGIGWVLDGDWDEHRRDIRESHNVLNGFIQRFEKDWNWNKTDYYNYLHKNNKKTEKYKQKGYEDLEDYLHDRCERYETLFNNIRENGYVSNHKGERKAPGSAQSAKSELEVLVTIDRDGNICHYDGHHRFAIAWILDISIPVHVVGRHRQWQKLRDNVYNNGLTDEHEDLRDHPDLQDILRKSH